PPARLVPPQGRPRLVPRSGGHPRRHRARRRLDRALRRAADHHPSRVRRPPERRPDPERSGVAPMTDLADQPARDRVESDTTATLFVEAGAGTGKTYALVRRLSTLLLDDEVPIDQIAAITFTEKAAAELRDRLRVHLVDRRDKGCVRADAALAGLDTAAIGTLHSFALRLLSENPLEAGIPPRVTAQQDTAEAAAVDALWQECATLL